MVGAKQDVAHTLDDVLTGYLPAGQGGGNFDPGLGRARNNCPAATVLQLHPRQHIGDRKLQAGEGDALASQPARARVNPTSLHQGVSQFLHDGFAQVVNILGQRECQRQGPTGEYRRAPEHGVLARGSFCEFQVGRARLMGLGGRQGDQAQQGQQSQQTARVEANTREPAAHCDAWSSPLATGAAGSPSTESGNTGNTTVYLARIAS